MVKFFLLIFLLEYNLNLNMDLYFYNNSKLYVSSGAGTWGPKMRLGTFNEIILFHLVNNP